MLKIYGREPTTQEYEEAFRLYGGNESELLCQDCATINWIDLKRHPVACKQCGSTSLKDTGNVAHSECPKCRGGNFNSGELGGIS
ncbi:MAG TPA: hypothetical protein VF020_13270 [Chthoniobacterales bacterium]